MSPAVKFSALGGNASGTEIGYAEPEGAARHSLQSIWNVLVKNAAQSLISTLTDLDGTFSAPLFVHGNTGWDALLHRIDMADDANLTAL